MQKTKHCFFPRYKLKLPRVLLLLYVHTVFLSLSKLYFVRWTGMNFFVSDGFKTRVLKSSLKISLCHTFVAIYIWL